jgi:antitoxin (DNA-binding transcriptional repressor) of toxin-antitoxin stability system
MIAGVTICTPNNIARVPLMKTLSVKDVEANFSAVADLVSTGESIRVIKNGAPNFFLIPETADTADILRQLAGARLSNLLKNAQPNEAAKNLSQDDVNKLIADCFA